MIVNVINLESRKDRWGHFESQAKEQNIQYKRWDGVLHITPFVGISIAHKRIIQHAKDNKLESVCVCEDDIEFSSPGAYDYFLKNIPEEYSMYLGCVYHGEIKADNTVLDFSSLTLYVVHHSFYDKFLSASPKMHLDRALKMMGKFVVCDPFVCKQIDGYSDNSKKITDYNNKYMGQRKFFNFLKHSS